MSMILGLPVRAEANLVSVRPGSTAFTRTPIGASSLAKPSVMLTMPALVIEYTSWPGAARSALTEATLTMAPPWPFMRRAACTVVQK